MPRYRGSRYWPSPESVFSPTGRSDCRAGRDCGAARWKALLHDWPVLLPRHLTNRSLNPRLSPTTEASWSFAAYCSHVKQMLKRERLAALFPPGLLFSGPGVLPCTETAAVPCIPRVAPGSGAETRAVRTGIATDGQHGAVIPPIYLSSTYAFAGFKDKRTYDYTRTANPTRDVLGLALAELEEGAGAVVTSTGLSAVLLVVQLLRPEDRLVAPHDCYGGTRRLLDSLAERGHFEVEYIDESSAGCADRGAESADPHALGRDPEQSVAPHHRSAARKAVGHARECAAGGGQHLPLACPAAAAHARRRHRGPLDHQVPERPQRRGRRCRRGAGTGAARNSWPGGPM